MKICSIDYIKLLLYKKEIYFIFSRTSQNPEIWGHLAYMRVPSRSFVVFTLSSFNIRKLISHLFEVDRVYTLCTTTVI